MALKRTRGATRPSWLPDSESFWNRVEKNGPRAGRKGFCWQWRGSVSSTGYGVIHGRTRSGRRYAMLVASRVAWELTHGPIPKGLLVCHACDNRRCVRPSHLFLGDDQANSDDKRAKKRGRWSRGEEQHLAKLDAEAVRIIRRERARVPPIELKDLADRFGVTRTAISLAARRKTWKHVG